LKCLEANLVNEKRDKKMAIQLIADFKKDLNNSPKENMD